MKYGNEATSASSVYVHAALRPPSEARPGQGQATQPTAGSLLADNRRTRTFKKVIRVVSKLFFSASAAVAVAAAVCWLIAYLDLTLPLLLQTVLEVSFFLRRDDDDSKEGRKTTATFRSFKHCSRAVIRGRERKEREREREREIINKMM